MKRAKHIAGSSGISGCPACITAAQIDKMPWENTYIDVMVRREKEFRAKHSAAIKRQEKDQAMRDLGLTKVRGALGGTYWE